MPDVNSPTAASAAANLKDTIETSCGRQSPWWRTLGCGGAKKVPKFIKMANTGHVRRPLNVKRLWVSDLWVARDPRRGGTERALLAAVEARAVKLGCAAIDFDLASENNTARSFYKHLKTGISDEIEAWRL